jgi:hypothetical protein
LEGLQSLRVVGSASCEPAQADLQGHKRRIYKFVRRGRGFAPNVAMLIRRSNALRGSGTSGGMGAVPVDLLLEGCADQHESDFAVSGATRECDELAQLRRALQ